MKTVFYRSSIDKDLYQHHLPGEELLVWYGKDYAKDLGIALEDERKEKEEENQAAPNIDPKTGLATIDPSK